jgi:8-oxo-dGTP pyrophosphatase MutT (NUDIX family)
MAHYNYYLDLTAEAFVVYKNTVLLRFHDKYNIWTGPGGHIDPGEDANEAVLREVWEEVGLKVELVGPTGWVRENTETNLDLVPPLFLNRHKINDKHDHSCFIFAARSDTNEVNPQTEADMGATCIWVTEEELDMMMQKGELRDETYRYARAALATVKEA